MDGQRRRKAGADLAGARGSPRMSQSCERLEQLPLTVVSPSGPLPHRGASNWVSLLASLQPRPLPSDLPGGKTKAPHCQLSKRTHTRRAAVDASLTSPASSKGLPTCLDTGSTRILRAYHLNMSQHGKAQALQIQATSTK